MNIYGDKQSGNCYKIQLLAALLNIKLNWIAINIINKETQTESFLAKNPNGKIPVLELDDNRTLAESNAILHFLAHNSSLIPSDPFAQAKILQWQFFEQYSHEPYIAVARFIKKYLGLPDSRKDEYLSKHANGYKALGVMEQQLQSTSFLVGDSLTLADISLYAYTHVAHEGGFDLTPYSAIKRWLQSVESQPGYLAMASD